MRSTVPAYIPDRMSTCTCNDLFAPLLAFFVVVVSAVLVCKFGLLEDVAMGYMGGAVAK